MGKIDLSGKRFGKLVVLQKVGKDKHRNFCWLCRCDCGNETVATSHALVHGITKSCGCLKIEKTIERNTHCFQTMRSENIKLYNVWAAIKQRCCNPNNKRFKDYGGRGITLFNDWLQYEPFYEWAIQNGYKTGLEIDRIDNDKGYSPENCHFVTRRDNSVNKRTTVFVQINGENIKFADYCEQHGISKKQRNRAYKILRTRPQEEIDSLLEAWDGK